MPTTTASPYRCPWWKGGKARPVVRQEVSAGRGPYSFALEGGGPGAVWELAASDPDGGRDAVTLTAEPAASARLTAAPVQAYGEYVTVALTSDAHLSAAPAVALEIKAPGRSRGMVPVPAAGPPPQAVVSPGIRADRGPGRTCRKQLSPCLGGGDSPQGSVSRLIAASAHHDSGRLEIPLNLRPAVPGEGGRPCLRVRERFFSVSPPTSAYAPVYPQASSFSADGNEGAQKHRPRVCLRAGAGEFRQACRGALPRFRRTGHAPARLAVYRQGRKGGWGFAGNRLSRGSTRIGARVRNLGRFAVLADETAPAISGLTPSGGAVLERSPGLLSARVVRPGLGNRLRDRPRQWSWTVPG